jgi:hypothetical protein
MAAMRIRYSMSLLALAAGTVVAVPTSAQAATCAAPIASTTKPGYTVADPNCDFATGAPFVPLTDAAGAPISRTFTGIVNGQAYRIEVPLHWNGDLAIFAHGFRGNGLTVFVDNPSLRAFQLQNGFAWAASSYQTNGYDPGQGAVDSDALIALFTARVGQPARHVYMTGASMGGHVTAAAIERFRGDFVAAMPYCGVLADARLFDFFTDVNATAAALTHTPITFPTGTVPADFAQTYSAQVQSELPKLGDTFGRGVAPTLTPLGQQWSAAVEQRSGGTRPGFDSAFAFWGARPSLAPLNSLPFHFGIYPGLAGGTAGIAAGNVVSNQFTIYQEDGNPLLNRDELRLNRDVLRVRADTRPSRGLDGLPGIAGDPRIPVLSLHDLGDLFVPYSMEQIYAVRTILHGQGNLFVSRAIRGVNHCDFTQAELQTGFTDLVNWVRTGHRPAGDDLLNPRAVANAAYGCRFTQGNHPAFVAPACPA